ncbi:hypothetical protein [Geotalea sp. SG265]|uniref:hypothetical protein n=1 Tax=Geotalea sp. SG265 TaxID=2922867 RepID=UPI001FAFDC1F|nr:hypothetical protein [Geotalea sp. SG265]
MIHSDTECLVYLDHNILDSVIKGDPHNIQGLLDHPSFVPVFSNENLQEINKSKGYEDKFLDVLRAINAKHIKAVLDEKFAPTGRFETLEVDPGRALNSYNETVAPFAGADYGLIGMLQKFYGGLPDSSFDEIFAQGTSNLMEILTSSIAGLKDDEGVDPNLLKQFDRVVNELPELLAVLNQQLSGSFSGFPGSEPQVRQFEEVIGIAPKILNNVKGPDVLLQIWGLVKEKLPGADIDMESFFGIKSTPWSCNPEREPTVAEKVNAIYHQLNFVGYHRDSKMKIERRFNASFSDMTHAGMASFCHIFLCRDEGLVMKAAAAYEYLNVGTKIYHLK